MRRRTRSGPYSYELAAAVEAAIPASVVAAMAAAGWNAFGVYEVVRDKIDAEKAEKRKAENSNGER